MTYLLFGSALSLSILAEFYAIMGLIAIFAGAKISIALMGAALGVAKLVVVSWLYRNWKTTSLLLKTYFTIAVGVLMLLTSMGIFGFLSKAHLDQNVTPGDVIAKVQIYDEKIRTAKENIESNRRQLKQMDEAVDQIMGRSTSEEGATKANNIRRSQQRERSALAKEIEAEQKLIASLNEEAAPLRAEVRKVEAEVGPIKYVAALIYDDTSDYATLEKAVRWMIILIVLVFDPLAVLMFIAYNQSIPKKTKEVEEAVLAESEMLHEKDEVHAEDSISISIRNPNTGIGRQII